MITTWKMMLEDAVHECHEHSNEQGIELGNKPYNKHCDEPGSELTSTHNTAG